jgi:hypothetical protein
MADINAAFPSKYLRAADLGDDAVVVTIDRITNERLKNQQGVEESRPAIHFHEFPNKPLVLNKTNAKKISQLLKSTDTDDWEHQQVQLYATETQFGADTVACIRVKQAVLPTKKQKDKYAQPPSANPAPDPDDTDAVPF